jgi:hypothetical protein
MTVNVTFHCAIAAMSSGRPSPVGWLLAHSLSAGGGSVDDGFVDDEAQGWGMRLVENLPLPA